MITAWTGAFIAADHEFDGAPLLRHETRLAAGHGAVARACLLLSALGVVEASINGAPTSPDVLTPGWTSCEWRLRCAEHDVTALLPAPSAHW